MRFLTEGEVAWASPEKQFVLRTREWRFQRPALDDGRCNGCGICSLFCPSGCIGESGQAYAVDMDFCKGCGVCARLCPRDAIHMEME